jgi:hypothetical protein
MKTALNSMTWSQDSLVRDIYSEIDDRDLSEIADAVMDVYFGSESAWEEEARGDLGRSFEEPKATNKLTKEEAINATTLASKIVDWANYGVS